MDITPNYTAGLGSIGFTTGNSGYIPAQRNFEYRCYGADTGYYAIGIAEKLVDSYMKMLNKIKEQMIMCEEKGLLAGFGKVDMTPDYPVSLGGYGDEAQRKHEMVAEPIYTTCIALTEGEETILVYTSDMLSCYKRMADDIRLAVTAATGIPGEKIFCAATHSHSAPAYGIEKEFCEDWKTASVKAARLALADQAPAKVLAAKKEIHGMNFVRHYMTANGTPAGTGFGSFKDNPAVGYMSQPDRQLLLIKLEREGLKKPILLVNWQGHPDCGTQIGRRNMAPSYPGPLRDTLSALSGCLVAYFTGADGNTNISTAVIKADDHGLNWREYGAKMAQLAYEAMKELREVEGTGIATKREIVEVEIDHSWDHLLPQAKEVFDLWKTVGLKEANELGKTYGFTSARQANAIIRRYSMEKTGQLELNTFRVGGIGFTTGTYEMFSESGISIRENSPYEFTFLLTGNFSYIPSDAAFNYRCYEADTGYYARGTAEKLVDKYLEMLKEIQG